MGTTGRRPDGWSSAGAPPDHVAVPYPDPAVLARSLLPLLTPVIAAGGPVLAVLAGPERDALRAVLGTGAAGVEFADPERVHDVPAFTVATRWARRARAAAGSGVRGVVVGQQVPACGGDHWARLDIALDVALEGLPLTVLCPLTGPVGGLHPLVLRDGVRVADSTYVPPTTAIRRYPLPPAPDLGPPAAHLHFSVADLHALRAMVEDVAAGAGLEPGRVDDLVLAVNELASNSVEHGPGAGTLRMWADGDGVTAEIGDTGTIDVPFPGLVAPPVRGARGRGLWLASELTDVLQVWSGPDGTTFRATSHRKMNGV